MPGHFVVGDLSAKAEGAEEAMAEVAAVAAAYTPLARLASAVYFVIVELASLHPLYRHDLHSYLDLFARILDDDHPHTVAYVAFQLLYRDSEGNIQMASWNFQAGNFLSRGPSSCSEVKNFLEAFKNWMSTAAVAAPAAD